MKAVWCVGVVLVGVTAVLVEGKHLETANALFTDPYALATWQMEAGRYAEALCEKPDKLYCYKRLPGCRYLLFYGFPYSNQVYLLIREYISQCSIETNAGWNVSAMPTDVDRFYHSDMNSNKMLYNMGVDPDNMGEMFECMDKKYHNPNAFKDCINK